MQEEENIQDGPELIVVFREGITVNILDKDHVKVGDNDQINLILRSFDASISKLIATGKEQIEIGELDRYYVIRTKNDLEKLRDNLLKERDVEAAYIKPLAEDPEF